MFHGDGHLETPFVILHGGAGPLDPGPEAMEATTKILVEIGRALVAASHLKGLAKVAYGLSLLENHPRFNAGYGSAVQRDGISRLTAALMNGPTEEFSAVIGATDLITPSRLALSLQGQKDRVIAPPGTELLARQLQLPVKSPVTSERRAQWLDSLSCDTVGVVSVERSYGSHGSGEYGLYAGASTGGRGGEFPGRVSDSGTVAGTYATRFAAIAATGVGEQIVDDAVAARLETRVRDGMSLREASLKAFHEAQDKKRLYGWISADANGSFACAHTTPAMGFVVLDYNGEVIKSS